MKKPAIVCFFLFLFLLLWAQDTQESIESASITEWAEPEGEVTAEEIAEEDLPELDIEALLRRRITEIALEHLGVPYKTAGITPAGFDCSGFIFFVFWEAAGMEISRSTVGIWNSGKKITLEQAQPGDILVFTTVRAGASHAGIVLENGPQGVSFAHAASQGSKTGVIISNMNESYYKARYMGARNYF